MSDPIPSDEIRIKTVAAAEAIYRLSAAANFDAALRFELRKKSAEAISLVAALSSPECAWRRPDHGEDLYAAAAGIVELVKFARDMRFIIPENAERVLNTYDAIKEYAVTSTKTFSRDATGEINGRFDQDLRMSPDQTSLPEEPALSKKPIG